MEQDDDIDVDQDDEQDVEYTEDDSNNNPDGEHLEETDRNGDNTARSMPNENIINDAPNSTHDASNADNNHTSTGHHMKNSPSDEEFYGGPSTGKQ